MNAIIIGLEQKKKSGNPSAGAIIVFSRASSESCATLIAKAIIQLSQM